MYRFLGQRFYAPGRASAGMGEEKTPKPFISACNQFKYLDLLYSAQQIEEKEQEQKEKEQQEKEEKDRKAALSGRAAGGRAVDPSLSKAQNAKLKDIKNVCRTINAIINKFSDEDGWLSTGKLGDQLSKRMPEFDVRNYGFSKLTPFIKSLGEYEMQKIPVGGQKQIYVRLKDKKNAK